MDESEIRRIERKVDRAFERKDFKEVKELYIELAAYLTCYGDHEGGLDAYKSALSICEDEGWESGASVIRKMVAETQCELGEYEEAVKHANLHLKFSKKVKNKIEEQRGYATLGRIYFCWAEYLANEKSKNRRNVTLYLNKSLTFYKESLRICLAKLDNVEKKEKEEMKSRLFQNLGLVMGSLGKYEDADRNFAIAIQINKTNNFKENLYWCYLNQSECFIKAGACANACTYCDLAVKVASTRSEECEALKLKGKALVKLGNISKAKSVLRSVHKKQQGKDREATQMLRITVFLCKIEKMISSTSNEDYKEKKYLYERKGDAYCALKLFEHGIEAYLKMLDFAELSNASTEDLLPCYTSLAQTYRDSGQYHLALFYCEKELELIKENSLEASKTYMIVAELYEILNHDYDLIYGKYKKALEIAQEIGDRVQEVAVLNAIIQMQTDFSRFAEADKSRKALEDLGQEFDDYGNESDYDDVSMESFDCDVDDSELLSDDEDIKSRHHARRNCYKIKRNQKGETELHVAAINGDLTNVKRLLERGHPVNEKDLAGWTALHEASNHGYYQIVSLLLDHGADVNDPGGEQCDGITPLHDAAENGHFNVIRILLKSGACNAVVTNTGDTPLDCLKRWEARTDLNERDKSQCEEIKNYLKSNLDTAASKEQIRRLTTVRSSKKRALKSSRESMVSKERKTSSAIEMYKSVMERIRRRWKAKSESGKKLKKTSKPALIDEEEEMDDCVEEDVDVARKKSKRRKTEGSSSNMWPQQGGTVAANEIIELESDADSSEKSQCSSPVNATKKISGNSIKTEEPEVVFEALCSKGGKRTVKHVEDKNKESSKELKIWFKFKVKIMNDVFIIPVSERHLITSTVQWLADTAADRYCNVYGKKPKLLLTTGEGAIFTGDDPLMILDDEHVNTRVLEWKTLNLGEMYTRLIRRPSHGQPSLSVFPDPPVPVEDIANALNIFDDTGELTLRNLKLELRHFLPIVDIIRKTDRDAVVVDLSCNYLGDAVINPLMDYLEGKNFRSLYLTSNGITSRGIKLFIQRISKFPEAKLNQINCLDIGFNDLGDSAEELLKMITNKLKNLTHFGTEFCEYLNPEFDEELEINCTQNNLDDANITDTCTEQ